MAARRRLSAMLDYNWPIIGGLAAWVHCLLGADGLARWQRTNPDHESAELTPTATPT